MKEVKCMISQFKKKANKSCDRDLINLIKIPSREEVLAIRDFLKLYSYGDSFYVKDVLKTLLNFYLPQIVVDFYMEHTEVNKLELVKDVISLSLDGIKCEDSKLLPGALLMEHGVAAFANTNCGNSICLDFNMSNGKEPQIVIADRKRFEALGSAFIEKGSGNLIRENLSYEVINKYLSQLDISFSVFLGMLVRDEIDDIEELIVV